MKILGSFRTHGIDLTYSIKIDRNIDYALKFLFGERSNFYDLYLWVKESPRKWKLIGTADGDTEKKRIALTDFFFEEPSVFDLKTATDFEHNMFSKLLGITRDSLRVIAKEAKMIVLIPVSRSYSLMLLSSIEDTNMLKETRVAEIISIARILVEELTCPKCGGRLEEYNESPECISESHFLDEVYHAISCDSCNFVKSKEKI